MNFNISSISLLSYIMALSLNKYGIDKISVRKENLKSYGRYYSLNHFSKKFLEHIEIWDHMESKSIVPYNTIEIYKKDIKTLSFHAKDINIDYLGYIINEDNLINSVTKKITANKSFNFIKFQIVNFIIIIFSQYKFCCILLYSNMWKKWNKK